LMPCRVRCVLQISVKYFFFKSLQVSKPHNFAIT
jgi:hypothetical protein